LYFKVKSRPSADPFPKPVPKNTNIKRKIDQTSDEMSSKNQRVEDYDEASEDSCESGTCDLIVLGLSFKARISINN